MKQERKKVKRDKRERKTLRGGRTKEKKNCMRNIETYPGIINGPTVLNLSPPSAHIHG